MENSLAQDKAFNALVYFAERIKPLYLTKAIKMLYIADEKAIQDSGVPITWLTYKAWKLGPVPEDIYFPVKQAFTLQECGLQPDSIDQVKLSAPNKALPDAIVLEPKKPFNDDQFSDYEIDILQSVVQEYGRFTGEQLIEILHKEGSLWHNVVEKNNLHRQFELKSNRSDYVVELTELIDTEYKKAAFEVAYQSYLMQANLF